MKSIVGKNARPAPAAVDAHARAAFLDGETLERADQGKPALELAATAYGDGAEFATVRDIELRHRRAVHRLAIPCEPKQRRARVQILRNSRDIREVIAFGRLPDEPRDQRPRLMHARGVDADSLTLSLNVRIFLRPALNRQRSRGRHGRSGHCWHG